MIAMQYSIKLPSDYDMGIIKDRVKVNGFKTDGFTGLLMKAYLIAEKDKYGNAENQYAPFYLWKGTGGMNKFLLEGYYNNIINSFGWGEVESWMVLHAGVEDAKEGSYAMVQRLPVPAYSNLENIAVKEQQNYLAQVSGQSTKAYISAYRPDPWELCRFHLTGDLDMLQKISQGTQLIYDVHHIS